MSSFTGSFDNESRLVGPTRPFDDDGYIGYDPRHPSQRFDSFSNFDANSIKDSTDDSSPIFTSQSYNAGDDIFSSQPVSETPPSTFSSGGGGPTAFSPEQNDGRFGASDRPILPAPAEMEPEDGFALRVWRRQNAIQLEEKEKEEKEMRQQIIEEAEEYKTEFYKKRQLTIENKNATNREKEKLFLANREKFHSEAEKNNWKAIAELIPHEVPAIQKRGTKDQEKKKPSVVVLHGPKPGKPTDMTRMRQVLLKLKHNPLPHMKLKPPPAAETKKDAKSGPTPAAAASTSASGAASSKTVATAAPEAIAVA